MNELSKPDAPPPQIAHSPAYGNKFAVDMIGGMTRISLYETVRVGTDPDNGGQVIALQPRGAFLLTNATAKVMAEGILRTMEQANAPA